MTANVIAAYVLAAIAIISIAVLTGLNHQIPTVLEVIAAGAVGGGLGATSPGGKV